MKKADIEKILKFNGDDKAIKIAVKSINDKMMAIPPKADLGTLSSVKHFIDNNKFDFFNYPDSRNIPQEQKIETKQRILSDLYGIEIDLETWVNKNIVIKEKEKSKTEKSDKAEQTKEQDDKEQKTKRNLHKSPWFWVAVVIAVLMGVSYFLSYIPNLPDWAPKLFESFGITGIGGAILGIVLAFREWWSDKQESKCNNDNNSERQHITYIDNSNKKTDNSVHIDNSKNKNSGAVIIGIVAVVIVFALVLVVWILPTKNNQPENSKTLNEKAIIYTINGDGETLTACINSASANGDVSISAEQELDGKTYKVTAIGAATMSDNDKVNSINLPNTVERIEANAFKNFSGLEKVTLPESISYIGAGAFGGCVQLQQVNINKLTAWCKIDFDGEYSNPLYYATLYLNNAVISGEVVLNDSITTIPDCTFKNSAITSIEMSDNVTYLGKDAFVNCTQLTTVVLSENLTEIFEGTFSGCGNLQTLEIPFVGGHPEAIKEDPSSLFGYIFGTKEYEGAQLITQYCVDSDNEIFNRLITITGYNVYEIEKHQEEISEFDKQFKEYLKSRQLKFYVPYSISNIIVYGDIPAYAFWSLDIFNDQEYYDSLNIKKINIKNAKQIGFCSFSGLMEVKEIEFPEELKLILHGAFIGCSSLERVSIPDSVTYIGVGAFSNCVSLTSISIPDSVTYIGVGAFSSCYNLTSVTISDSVTSIGSQAFYGCTHLESITIGNGVTSIGDYAFYGCTSLESVTFNNPNSWYYLLDASATSATYIPVENLQNPNTAASFLKKYCHYYWKREKN